MKTFFSIIYLPFKPDLQEKISVGLVMSNGEKTIFKVSDKKLQIVKNLISNQRYNLVKSYLNNISEEVASKSNDFTLDIDFKTINNWLNESYFNYLNRYSNNLVIYSEPRNIDLEINSENFKTIFQKLIFDFNEEVDLIKIENILTKVKTKLYSKIEDRVNLNVTLKSSDFKELLTPVDVNFIGKNGKVVAGQTIDFVKRLYNLEHDLTSFISLTKAVDYPNKYKGKYFLVGQEPDKKEHPKNHKTWRHVRDSHLVEYVDLEETEKIQEYIFSKDVTPFFEKEEISN
tara:strand:- start:23 stop:883 length:861 start_codon:yes stop_codon:yes gene_type:complete